MLPSRLIWQEPSCNKQPGQSTTWYNLLLQFQGAPSQSSPVTPQIQQWPSTNLPQVLLFFPVFCSFFMSCPYYKLSICVSNSHHHVFLSFLFFLSMWVPQEGVSSLLLTCFRSASILSLTTWYTLMTSWYTLMTSWYTLMTSWFTLTYWFTLVTSW